MDNDRQDGLLYLDIYMVVAHVGVMVKAKAYGNLVSPTQVPNALATELAKAVVLVSLDILEVRESHAYAYDLQLSDQAFSC